MRTAPADGLSQLFESVEISSTALTLCELRDPWGISFPGANAAILHAVTVGAVRIEYAQGAVFQLEPGDVLLTTRFRSGRMMSRPNAPLLPFERIWAERGFKHWTPSQSTPAPQVLRLGGSGARTTLMAVMFGVREPWRRNLLLRLPPHLHFKRSESVLAPWLEAALSGIVEENTRQPLGYAPMAQRIAELVLFSCIRSYWVSPAQRDREWLSALTDPRLASVIGAMRDRSDQRWTLARLAAEAGMSRSAFAARFHEVVGMSPMNYVRGIRMQEAAEGLAARRITVKDAARRTGYASTAAFRSAFKRQFGITPHRYGRGSTVS